MLENNINNILRPHLTAYTIRWDDSLTKRLINLQILYILLKKTTDFVKYLITNVLQSLLLLLLPLDHNYYP
jgi:hypothetical protein